VTHFPSQMALGVIGDPHVAYRVGRTLGAQLLRVGVNMNLAPVLDVNTNPANPVINLRSFGGAVAVVRSLGTAYVKGLQSSGCIAVGKHFPGHGATARDSHTSLPTVNRTFRQLWAVELLPFRDAIEAGLAAVMSAHVAFPRVKADGKPATLSHLFLTTVLRHDLGFKGLVLTDDLSMAALRPLAAGEVAVRSVLAGADIVLSTGAPATVLEIRDALADAVLAGRIPPARLRASVLRILRTKSQHRLLMPQPEPGATLSPLPSREDPDVTSLLAAAADLNTNVSQAALVYSGPVSLLAPPASVLRVFVIYHDFLRSLIDAEVRDTNDLIQKDLAAVAGAAEPPWAREGTIVYPYFLELDPGPLTLLRNLSLRRRFHVVALCSGNPYQFQAATSGLFDGALLTLSNTPASLRAMAAALAGWVIPPHRNLPNAPVILLPGSDSPGPSSLPPTLDRPSTAAT